MPSSPSAARRRPRRPADVESPPAAPRPAEHVVTRYARDVVEGRVVAGRLVRLACERHLRDLERGPARGLRFDEAEATLRIGSFRYLRHSKGEWAGRPVVLEPWQAFVVGSAFGWKRADGLRRFRTVYEEIARKNGKSTKIAGVGVNLAFWDREPGAEVYVAATKKDQAKISWLEARRSVARQPELRRYIRVLTSNLSREEAAQKFEPLGGDSDNLDGLNSHGVLIDELHKHKTRDLWDVMVTSTGSRRQPLIWAITTAGTDTSEGSVCWEQREYATKVLEQVFEDDSFFAYVACIDEGDDWREPAVWPKANPNLGISVKADTLQDEAKKAAASPAAQDSFRRLRCGVWTQAASAALSMDEWRACGEAFDPAMLAGRPCYGGLDLSTVIDTTAFVLLFPPVPGEEGRDASDPWHVLTWIFVPEAMVPVRVRRDRVPYDAWVRDGHLEATPGTAVDYAWVRRRIVEAAARYQIREVGFDPYNCEETARILTQESGLKMVEVRQGHQSLAGPTNQFEALLKKGLFRHGGHPVLRWMASNVVWRLDANGNRIPSKGEAERSRKRIDGISALVTALSRQMGDPAAEVSVYETRGFRTL